MGKKCHRHGDSRVCGATTVVEGQSSVFIDGKLWAVYNDPNSHDNGRLRNTTGSSVFINEKPVIVHGPDLATADDKGHAPATTKTSEGASSTFCYP